MKKTVCILITARPDKPRLEEYRVGEVENPEDLYLKPEEPEDPTELNVRMAEDVFGRCRPFYDIKHAEGYAWAWQDGGHFEGNVEYLDFTAVIFPHQATPRRHVNSGPRKKGKRQLTAA